MSKSTNSKIVPAKNVTWADDNAADQPEAPKDAPSRASLTLSFSTPISTGLAYMKNAAVGRVVGWWTGPDFKSDQVPVLKSEPLPLLKEHPKFDDLESLTVSELISKLDFGKEPMLNRVLPTWPKKVSSGGGRDAGTKTHEPQSSDQEEGSFLRSDMKGQTQELCIEIQLARAKVCWLNRDYKAMARCAMRSLGLVEKFGYPEYEAKVCFYVAIACFGTKDIAKGRQFLKLAEKCKGTFREGELITWAGKEAALYERRIGKRRALPKKPITDTSGIAALKLALGSPPSVGADIPGRIWHPAKNVTSVNPEAVLKPRADKARKHDTKITARTPSPNETALGVELQGFEGQSE